MPPTHVFSVGLVPVQEWIGEAVRSRDLRAGSAFLSWLMAKVLARIERLDGATIELPRSPGGGFAELADKTFAGAMGSTYGIPNRASGFAPQPGLQTLLESLQADVIRPTWESWKRDFLRPTSGDFKDSKAYWDEVAPQIQGYDKHLGPPGDCPFRVVWVMAPASDGAPEDPKKTTADLERIGSLFARVKRSRRIEPWAGGAEVPKCTVCGKREALGPDGTLSDWQGWHQTNDTLPWVQQGYRVDPGERLCPVCLARRMAAYADRAGPFPSTGEVAAAPWLHEIRSRKGAPADRLRELEAVVARQGRDLGRALFEQSETLRQRGFGDTVAARDRLKKALDDTRKSDASRKQDSDAPARSSLSTTPPSYLALVAFDGDDLGQHLRSAPQDVSGQLHDFAQQAAKTLAFDDGTKDGSRAIFYLGGDEGVALLPAGQALATVARLHKEFAATVDGAPNEEKRPSLSAGLVYFEQKRPLGGALREAHALLHHAKSLPGKDALAVAVQTASGTRWQLAGRWADTDPVWTRVIAATEAIRDGQLSPGWAYDVEAFLESLDAETWGRLKNRPKLARLEVKRLLGRRVKGETARERRKQAAELWVTFDGDQLWEREDGQEIPRNAEQFHLMGFLARQLGVEPVEVDVDPAEEDADLEAAG